MYLSLSVPSDRVDVFRAAAAALLAAAAIISLISLISPVQELEAEINSFRLSGGGPAARSSAASAADPTSTPSPTVAVLSAPVLTAQAAEDGVELSWTTVHGATRYKLLVWDSSDNDWRQIGGDGLTGTTYTHTDPAAGTTYFYTIRAANADGETSAWSDYVSTATAKATHTPAATTGQPSDSSAAAAADPTPTASPTVAALAAPVLTAQAAEDGVELSWTTVHGATRYELLVWDSSDNDWRQIGGDGLTGTTYTHTDPAAGTTYFYTIRAANADGETSAWSDHVSTVTPTHTPAATVTPTHTPAATTGQPSDSSAAFAADPTPTPSPTIAALAAPVLTAQAAEDGVELSWTTVHGATRYELLVWDSVNDWRQIGGDGLTGTTYTHIDLVAGTTYFYTILAVNADGETSAWSDYVSTATATPTHTPTATATATHTPTATTGQPSDSSQNDVTVKDDSGNEGNVSPGQISEDKTRTEPRQGVTGPTVTITGGDGIVVVGGDNQVNGASFDVTITFSESVGATFDHTDITVTNAQSLASTDVSASTAGLIYTATIRPTAGFSGAVTVQVPAAAAQNASNEGNQASNVFSATATMQSACVTGGAVSAGDEYADLARDCAILLGLHDTLVGSSTSLNWSEDTLMTLWYGVTVVSNRVTSLNITPFYLSGTIPAELGDLTELKSIRLGFNDLTGSIPTELGNLTNLTELDLNSNDLTGTIPTELGSLANLTRLDLASNGLTGTIPTELGSLANLTRLALSGNDLTGTIPTELGSLADLTALELGSNGLTGTIPTELGSLADLTRLVLGNNGLTGTIPTELGSLVNLTALDLGSNGLTGTIPTELGSLVNLTALDLGSNGLTGTIPTELGSLVNLTRLDLSDNNLAGGIPTELGSLANLTELDLDYNNLTGIIPTELGSLENLTALELNNNDLMGGIPPQLGRLTNLTTLRLSDNRLTGSIPPQLGRLTNLTTLDLSSNDLTGSIPTQLGSLANLTTLDLSSNDLTGTIPTQLDNLVPPNGVLDWVSIPTGNPSLCGPIPTALHGLIPTTVGFTDLDSVYYPGGTIGPCLHSSFEQSSYTVGEGSSIAITVTLSADPERSVTIPISRTNQGGATDGDYSGVPTSLTFNSGDTEKSFTFAATQDTDNDDDESVKLAFGTLPTDVGAGTNNEATVNITDDDVPSVTVHYEQASYTVGEGSSVDVKVILSAVPERSVTIPISRTNQGGATDGDYSGVAANTSVTFNSGDTEKSITFAATDDSVDDDDESVLLGFGTLPTGVSLGTNGESTVNITDDDVPAVTVSYEQASYTVGEGSSVVVKVILSAVPERSVTIPISRTNQGGATDGDYSGVAANTSVTFNSGDTEKSITFAATDDSVDDDDESVLLGFGTLPTGVSLGTNGESTVNITDDDVPAVTVSYEQASYTVGEGSSVVVKVILSAVPERSVTIPISRTNQGGATDGDYSGVAANTSVTFNSGDTEKSITFAATDDSVDDDDESVLLGFGTLPTGVSLGTNGESTVNITDDDVPAVTVSYEQASYTVGEGSSVVVKVILSAVPERSVTIPISRTNQGGATDGDYSGVAANTSVTFNSGDTEKSITFAATDDSVDDDDESVLLGFGTLPTGVSLGTNGESTVNITDDDVPAVTVSYEQASYTVGEGSSVVVKVILSAVPERSVTIPISRTNQGGATDGDYSGVAANTSVTFNSGDTEKSITFAATDDSVDDDDESVLLGFGTLPTGVSLGTNGESTVNITDDDVPAVTVSYEQASYTVGEGSSVVVKVILSAVPERSVTIPISRTNQGGATDGDYSGVAANTSVTFNSGDTEKSITFAATDDSVDDDDESVLLGFGTLPTGVSLGTNGESTVNITDDDVPAVTVSYEQASYTVGEGSSVVVKVILSAVPERSVTIPISRTNQGGATDGDYSGVAANTSVTFNSGDTEKSITFAATDDSVDDDDESVLLGFGTLPTGVSLGTNGESTVNITDDDVPAVTVSYEQASYTVGEGSSVVVKVILSAVPERSVTIPISRTNQGGATDGDYSGVAANTSVTFNSGDTEKSITFAATDDSVDDDDESVLLSFGTLPTGVSLGTNGESTVNITDDDVPAVTVSYEQASYTVGEGSSVVVKVILSAVPERSVTIPISRTNQGGATDGDYSGVAANTSVTFNSGDTEKSITFAATDDSVDDDDESVLLSFGTLPTGVSAGSPATATVNITDDDVPTVTVRYEQATYTVGEGSSVVIKVILSADPERRVTISINRANQGGATDGDYSGVPANASVTFNSGDTEKSITFAATNDTVDDDGESVLLSFGTLPTGVSAGSPATATVNITDDDVPTVTARYEQSIYTVAEGSSVVIRVILSADPERTVTIPIPRSNKDGAGNGDYSGVPTSLTFNSGDTVKSFTFTAVQDGVDDDGESVLLSFGTLPTDVSLGINDESTVNITDDDVPSVTVRYEQASYTVGEGSSVVVKVKLSADPERSVTILINRTNQNGAIDGDYSGVPTSLTFNSGQVEKRITFAATDDSVDDDGESVLLSFGTLPTRVSAGSPATATVNITDNDVRAVMVRYEQASYTVGEGSSVVIKVILSADPERRVTISINRANQGGATTDDYSVTPTSLTFNSGETEKSITFAATDDSVNDDGESVRLGFGSLPTGVSAGTPRAATVNITDNDTGQPLNTVCGGPVSNLKGIGTSETHVLFTWGPPAGGCRLQAYIVEFSAGNGPECGADGSSSFDWTGSVKRVLRLPGSGIILIIWGDQTNGPLDKPHEGDRRHLRVKSVFVDSSESATFSGGVCAKVLSEETE